MNPKERLHHFLGNSGAKYDVLVHTPCRSSIESQHARATAGYPDAIGAKALVVFLQNTSEFILLVLPGPKRLDNTAVRRKFGSFRFATPDEVCLVADGLEIGMIPPFSMPVLPAIAELMIDVTLLDYEHIGFNAASFTTSIVMSSRTYASLPMPRSIENIAQSTGLDPN